MSGKTGYVEVTLRLPKPLVDFIKKFTQLAGEDANEFMEYAVKREVDMMLDNKEIFNTPWSDRETIVKANSLETVLDC